MPSIVSVTPNHGSVGGNTPVTLRGTGFDPQANVKFAMFEPHADIIVKGSRDGLVTLWGSIKPIVDERRFRQQRPQRHAMSRRPQCGTDASLQM